MPRRSFSPGGAPEPEWSVSAQLLCALTLHCGRRQRRVRWTRQAAPMQLPRIEHLGRPVAHRRRVVAAGLSTYRVRTAVATGRWQQPLPGVVVGHSGPLTRLERWQAALEYGGPDAVLSHRSALCALGARV